MPVEFQCDHCGTRLRTPDGSAGKKTKCPQCENVLAIPEASDSSQTFPPPVSQSNLITQKQPTPQEQIRQSPTPPIASVNSNGSADSGEWAGFESFGSNTPGNYDFGESGNPYQAPADADITATPTRQYHAVDVMGDQLDFGQAFTMTFHALKNNFMPFFILGCIYIGFYTIAFVYGLVLGFIGAAEPGMRIYTQIAAQFSNIAEAMIKLGLCLCALEVIRTGKTSFWTGISIFARILSLFVFGVLTFMMILIVVGLPIALFFGFGYLIDQGMRGNDVGMMVALIFVIPWTFIFMTIISCRLLFPGPMLIVDQKVSAFEAFRLSWAMTKRNTLTLFCIYLVFGVCALVGTIVTILLGSFVIIPFWLCLSAMCYHIMWEQYQAKIRDSYTFE